MLLIDIRSIQNHAWKAHDPNDLNEPSEPSELHDQLEY